MVVADVDSYEALLREIPELGALQATADLALTNPALANATIMRSYHALSNVFGRLLHGAGKVPENATFITFAGWAAASLRPEVALDDAGFSPASLLRPARSAYHWMARDVLGVDRAISRNIARGQGAIFEDIGSAVYKLLRVVLDALPEFDPDPEVRQRQWRSLWDGYTASLKEMPVYLNPRRNDAEGLDSADLAVLQRAVLPYFEVLMEGLSAPDVDDGARKRRAELILLANVRILAYEQKRLQPLLERNLAYIPDAVRDLVVHRLLHRDRWDARALRRPVTVSHGATALLVEAFQISATRNFYSMVLGTEEVRFGRDLPLPPAADPKLRDRHSQLDRNRYAAGAFFPHHLNNLDLSATWAEWQRHDRSVGQGARTATNNWLRYGERLSFLANLFRSRQQLTALYGTPTLTPSALPPRPAPKRPTTVTTSSVTARRGSTTGAGEPTETFLPDEILDQFANVGDRPADDLVHEVMEQLGRDARALDWKERRAAYPELMSAIELDEGGVVSAFLDAGEEIDDSIEEELVHRAQEFFEENGVAIVTTLFHASLPEAYLARRGVQVLDLTGELVSNWTQRIRETGQFLVSVLSSEGEPDTIGTTTLHHGQFAARVARRTRLRHAAVRWLLDAPYRPELPLLALEGLEAPAPWQVRMAQIGEVRVPSAPLNQEDLLGTLSTFTTVTFMALEKLAVSFDDDDRRAFHHLWNIIGWHLGIGDAESVGDIPVGSRPTWPHNRVLPLEFDEMDDLAHRLAARLQGPSDAGARLAKTLVQELAYPLPNRAHGAPDFLVRYMVGDAQADALQLGAGGYAQLLVRQSGALEAVARHARATRLARLAIPKVSEAITRYALRVFVSQSRGTASGFSIEPRIANRWGVQTGSEIRPRLRS